MPRILGLGIDLLRLPSLDIESVEPPLITNFILQENNDKILLENGVDFLLKE